MTDTTSTAKTQTTNHAWYSRKQHEAIFRRKTHSTEEGRPQISVWAKEDGQTVVATTISRNKNDSGCKFDDMEYRGEVVRWVASSYDLPVSQAKKVLLDDEE